METCLMGSSLSSIGACVCGRGIVHINEKRYLFQDSLAEGGFSYIDLVEDIKSGEFFAVKRIVCHDKKAVQDAQKEADYCKTFHHENIISLMDHCVKNKGNLTEVWLIFPFFKRGSLYDECQRYLATGSQFTSQQVKKIFLGICQGIQVLHDHNPPLAHRDLKPANILLSAEDNPVIMDLGSTAPALVKIDNYKEAQALQDLAAERCTMPYRAPELFNVSINAVVDEKVDIWSLGCILYCLLFLEGPFDKVWLKKDSVALAVQNPINTFPENVTGLTQFYGLIKSMLVIEPKRRPAVPDLIETINNVQESG